MVRVLIAPLEFKGSLAASEAADAIARGVSVGQPTWQLDTLPLSDGGPGFLPAMERAMHGTLHPVPVRDALGRERRAYWFWAAESRTAVIEAAQANGLIHIAPADRDAMAADTFGVGELLLAALEQQPRRILVGVGGSATTDGGAGMARALGARFLDVAGQELPPGGAALAQLAHIEWEAVPALRGVEVVVAADVTSPLLGPEGAALVYGPQKGASPEQAKALDAALRTYATVVERDIDVALAHMPGAGAAGGLAGGLVAFMGARIESGFDVVASATGLEERLLAADIVVTGEGSFDSQSRQGKGPGRLLELAARHGKRVVLFAGRASEEAPELHTLTSLEPDQERAMAQAGPLLEELARRWAANQRTG